VTQIELGIEQDYLALRLGDEFIEAFRELLVESMNEQQANVQFLHDTLRKQLAKLDVQEARLLDLAADDTMPKAKIKGRWNKLAMDRNRIQAGLRRTGDELKAGYDLLLTSLELSRDPVALYRRVPDEIHRLVNETFNERYFIDEHGEVAQALRKPPFDIFPEVVNAWRTSQGTEARAEVNEPPASPRAQNVNCQKAYLSALIKFFWSMFRVRPNWSG